MKTFICHYPKLKERIDYLLPKLHEIGFLDVNIINGMCRHQITKEHIQFFSNDEKIVNERKQKYNLYNPNYCSCNIFSDGFKTIIANFLTHIDIWKKISEQSDEYCLVLEDDAVVLNNFKEKWNLLLSEFPKDLDIAYLHEGCSLTVENTLHIKPNPNQIFYNCSLKWSRTCCSYIISKQFAIKLLNDLYPLIMSVDHEMNYLQKKLNANVYWTSPPLFQEGSGLNYSSSIPKNY